MEGIDAQVSRSDDDTVVVWVDTHGSPQDLHLRIRINDAPPIYDGHPELDEHPQGRYLGGVDPATLHPEVLRAMVAAVSRICESEDCRADRGPNDRGELYCPYCTVLEEMESARVEAETGIPAKPSSAGAGV